MYEQETFRKIGQRMLSRVDNQYDKREGSIIHDATYPAAVEFELLYALVDYFLKNTFGDTAEREFLVERAMERGLAPYEATPATVKIRFTPETEAVKAGVRLSYDDVNYRLINRIGDGVWRAECESLGVAGNKPAGRLVPIDYLRGVSKAELVEVIQLGEPEEETEAFRKRYLASFTTQSYGGNISDYQQKVGEIPGVGGVKVEPIWNGGGTVRIIFTDSEYRTPSEEFVREVQGKIDPIPYKQKGVGIAPIGHLVTVIGAQKHNVNIGLHVTLQDGDDWEDHEADIKRVISGYFDELNRTWQDTEIVTTEKYANNGLIVRISQIESRLLSLPYVEDISHTTINGEEENYKLDVNELASLGEVRNLGASV